MNYWGRNILIKLEIEYNRHLLPPLGLNQFKSTSNNQLSFYIQRNRREARIFIISMCLSQLTGGRRPNTRNIYFECCQKNGQRTKVKYELLSIRNVFRV